MDGSRDADAEFEELVAARWAAWLRLATLLCGSRPDAEDCLQTALTTLYARWPRVRAMENTEAYAKKMLVNTALSQRRRRTVGKRKVDLVGAGLREAETAGDIETRLELWQRVRRLPARQRATIVLRYYEDLTVDQTAVILGCSPGTVKSQTSDALRTLVANDTGETTPDRYNRHHHQGSGA